MKYRFKPLQELYWGLLTGVGIVLFQALLTLEPEKVSDWRAWAVGLGGALVRVIGGAGIDYVRRSMTADPEPTLADEILALPESDLAALRIELERRRAVPTPPAPLFGHPPQAIRLSDDEIVRRHEGRG